MAKSATKAKPPSRRVIHHVRWNVSSIILALTAAAVVGYVIWQGVDPVALVGALKILH